MGNIDTYPDPDVVGTYIPAGSIVQTLRTTAPTGWLLMQGQVLNPIEALYPNLAAALGVTGSYTLPDGRGRVLVGLNASDTDFDVIGELRGAKTHALTSAEMPSHDHPALEGAFVYNTWPTVHNYASIVAQTGGATEPNYSTTGPRGGGGAHNNVQPSLVVNHMIKT